MKKSRYTDTQIISILKQAAAGAPVPELCREHGMWTCPVKVPDTYLIYAAKLSNARGLLPPSVECRRREL
jgi:hypothetical protein